MDMKLDRTFELWCVFHRSDDHLFKSDLKHKVERPRYPLVGESSSGYKSNSIGEYLVQKVLKNKIKINEKAWINEVPLSKLGFLGSVRSPNVAHSRWTALSLSFLARKPKRRVCFSTSPSSTSPSSLWASSATSPPASLNRLVSCLSRRPYLEHGRLSLNLDVSVLISQSSLSRWLSSSTSPSSLSVEPRRLFLEPRRLCLNLSIFALSVTFILDFSVFSLSLSNLVDSLSNLVWNLFSISLSVRKHSFFWSLCYCCLDFVSAVWFISHSLFVIHLFCLLLPQVMKFRRQKLQKKAPLREGVRPDWRWRRNKISQNILVF